MTCVNQNDEILEHHIHRPRHSFFNSEYLDSDQLLKSNPMHNVDSNLFTASATNENEDNDGDLKPASRETPLQNNHLRNCTFYDAQFSIFSDYYGLYSSTFTTINLSHPKIFYHQNHD